MATNHHNLQQPTINNPRKVCFSFAAYAKTVIAALKSSNVHVACGLTDDEFSAVESLGNFTFPPDLRAILSMGLPLGPGFPNWRSSSCHQLCLLTSLPILSLAKEVSRNNFWVSSWGPRPYNIDEAHSLAHKFLVKAPPLVPIFRYCYIPSEPKLAGNPIFYVHGSDVKLLSIDVGGFFKETEFRRKDCLCKRHTVEKNTTPPWAQSARRVEFWTDLSARENESKKWWNKELNGCFEEVIMKLKDGGWTEDEVNEMMLIDGFDWRVGEERSVSNYKESVVKHVRKMSIELLNGGWSVDDVVYSLSDDSGEIESGLFDGENWVEFECISSSNSDSLIFSD
ncbi:unnamed protein product [Amaranthus hypochondriacus]